MKFKGLVHRLITIQIEHFMSSFQGFFVHNNPEAEAERSSAQAALNYKTERENVRNSFGPLLQGFCEGKTPKSDYPIFN